MPTERRNRSQKTNTPLLVLLALLFALATGIRLFDLDDPPLDFHSTRQLRSLIIARGMYYEGRSDLDNSKRDVAVEQWEAMPVIEPPLTERIVALTYRVIGEEVPWVGRVYSSLFWMGGGIPLFLLARRLTNTAGGVLALAYYLFLPFGIIASRSFQPDPLMVCLVIFSWWAFYRWFYDSTWGNTQWSGGLQPALRIGLDDRTWGNTLLAGGLIGAAIFVKSVAVLMLFGGVLGLILVERKFGEMIRSLKAWVVALLAVLPALLFMLYGLFALQMSSQFEGRFFPEMLVDPAHYVRWLFYVIDLVGFAALIGALLGILLFRRKPDRVFILGIWAGYLVYGLLFPYHFLTHNYYHLPLIPLIGLSLAPLGRIVAEKFQEIQPGILARTAGLAVLLVAVLVQVWDARVTLAQEDYRHEPPYWQAIGEVVGLEADVVALSQDYGNRIAYYGWVNTTNWPGTGQQNYRDLRGGKPLTFEEQFDRYTAGQDLFLVTRLKEFEDQGDLYRHLTDNYPVIAEGQGYLLFDLRNPLP